MCYLIELQGPEDVLDLANLWTDEIEEEHSGDELVAPSYAYEASGGPDVSGGLDIADQWSDSEIREVSRHSPMVWILRTSGVIQGIREVRRHSPTQTGHTAHSILTSSVTICLNTTS